MNLLIHYLVSLNCLILYGVNCANVEFTFELEDNSKQCFFEDIPKGTKATIQYQVIKGGKRDVDCSIEDPDGLKLYSEKRKTYDSYQWDSQKSGAYKICFSNEFSTITHKVVYFDIVVGDEPPLLEKMNQATALNQMETSCATVHEQMNEVINFQTHFRLREFLSRTFADELNQRVQIWSSIQLCIMVMVMVGQVLILRSFFASKRHTSRRTDT